MKRYFLIVLLVSLTGCPVTCFVNPSWQDYFLVGDSVEVTGLLLDYDLENSIQGVIGGEEMLCNYLFYQENYDDYLSLGGTTFRCDTSSASSGIFSVELLFPDPGLYRIQFTPPIVQPEIRLITSRPELQPAADQLIFFDWESDSENLDEYLAGVFQRTLDLSRYMSSELVARLGAEMVKVETERVTESYYDNFRIYLSEETGPDVTTVRMSACAAGDYSDETCPFSGYAGLCNLDYSNGSRSTEWDTCDVYAADTLEDGLVGFGDRDIPPDDSVDVRIGDIAYALGRTATHELGHAFGLVASSIYRGGVGHNPMHPSFVAALRHTPNEVMLGTDPLWARHTFTLLLADCDNTPRSEREPGFIVTRCPGRWNQFNWQYLNIVQ